MVLKKGDFIEIDFTGKIKEGEVFDSTLKEELDKLHTRHDHKIVAKPFIFSIGQGMFVKGVDEFLVGKEIGSHKVVVKPEDGFGKRDPKQIQLIPKKTFVDNNLNPIPGASFNFDGRVARVLTVSGGRVMVDFNHPLAGKELTYIVDVKRKVDDVNEKINALNEFLFRQKFDFDVDGKKLTLKVPKQFLEFALLFKDKYKDILGLDLDAEVIKEDQAKEKKTEEKK